MNERDKELWSKASEATKNDSWDEQVAFMQRFAELIRADEREACAKVCDNWPIGREDVCEIASFIRVRGVK